MSMTDEQKGVARGAVAAIAITGIGLAGAIVLLGPKFADVSVLKLRENHEYDREYDDRQHDQY